MLLPQVRVRGLHGGVCSAEVPAEGAKVPGGEHLKQTAGMRMLEPVTKDRCNLTIQDIEQSFYTSPVTAAASSIPLPDSLLARVLVIVDRRTHFSPVKCLSINRIKMVCPASLLPEQSYLHLLLVD